MVLKIVDRKITWCENVEADAESLIAISIRNHFNRYSTIREEAVLEEFQSIMGRLITHLVKKGLINNDDLMDILNENSYNRRFEVVEVEDEV